DPSGITYRLPTAPEWLRGARAGATSGFSWRDDSDRVKSANFLGPEPALETDTTAAVRPTGAATFRANPWGLLHPFGNVAEWATSPAGGFVRMVGHFRSEPNAPVEIPVTDAQSTGPDPYVGVRPAFDLDAARGTALVRRALASDSRLAALGVAF